MTVADLLERFAELPPTSVVRTAAGSMTTFAGLPERHRQHANGITLRPGAKIPASVAAMSASLKHELGVWLHTQRFRERRGELDPAKADALDAAAPGWRTGRTRGRKPKP